MEFRWVVSGGQKVKTALQLLLARFKGFLHRPCPDHNLLHSWKSTNILQWIPLFFGNNILQALCVFSRPFPYVFGF